MGVSVCMHYRTAMRIRLSGDAQAAFPSAFAARLMVRFSQKTRGAAVIPAGVYHSRKMAEFLPHPYLHPVAYGSKAFLPKTGTTGTEKAYKPIRGETRIVLIFIFPSEIVLEYYQTISLSFRIKSGSDYRPRIARSHPSTVCVYYIHSEVTILRTCTIILVPHSNSIFGG